MAKKFTQQDNHNNSLKIVAWPAERISRPGKDAPLDPALMCVCKRNVVLFFPILDNVLAKFTKDSSSYIVSPITHINLAITSRIVPVID